MTLTTILLQVLLTIPLTIIINFFKNKENRRLNQIIIPSVYIIIISAILPIVKENIFLIVIFEIFIRNFYVTNITNQQNNISNIMFIFESIISVALSLFTYNYFIKQVNTVIPNPEEIKGFIWFLIILYITSLYSQATKNKTIEEKIKNKKHQKEKVIMEYAKFKNIYSSSVKSKSDLINNLVYAIMIYENSKTPKLYRNLNAYIGLITKKETKFGIMQVPSYERLSDEESIKRVISTFEKQLKNTELKENDKLNKLLSNYKQDERNEILENYSDIVEFSKK